MTALDKYAAFCELATNFVLIEVSTVTVALQRTDCGHLEPKWLEPKWLQNDDP